MINVLIVDDDKLARTGLANAVKWSDYDMQVTGQASNGKRALEFISQNHVDLVFVDIGMPVMNGIELMRKCRGDYPGVQFVVLSFHEDFDYVQEALRLGVIDYISKEQTELDDYGSIMQRIVNRMKMNSEEEYPEAEEADKLISLMEGVLWIYDDLRFEEIIAAAYRCGHCLRAAERAVVAEISQTCTVMGIPVCKLPVISNIVVLKEALEEARRVITCSVLQQNNMYSRMMTVADAVKSGYMNSINSKQVAESIGLSRSHFSTVFQKTVGIQFNLFLRRERIRNALRLLRDTNLNQYEISEKVGYLDIKNFNSAFKSIMMCSPGEYKASVQKDAGI